MVDSTGVPPLRVKAWARFAFVLLPAGKKEAADEQAKQDRKKDAAECREALPALRAGPGGVV